MPACSAPPNVCIIQETRTRGLVLVTATEASPQANETNAIDAKRRSDLPRARAANAREPPPGAGSLFARGFGDANRARRGLSGGTAADQEDARRPRRLGAPNKGGSPAGCPRRRGEGILPNASRTGTRRRPRSRRPCVGPRRLRRRTPRPRNPRSSSFRSYGRRSRRPRERRRR